MQATRRGLLAATAVTAAAPRARAQGRPKIRIGVLNDQSGTYRDTTGLTSIACVQQAVQDFGDRGFEVEVLRADHQNRPDTGATIARQWIDRDGVDVIADVPTSSVALAVGEVCRQKDRIHLNASATAVALTGEQCSPNTIVWSFDTYMMAASTGGAVVKAGGDSWFFVTADYAFGHSLEQQTTLKVTAAGGTVKGSARYPFPDTTDFSAFITRAMSSGAKVLGLANAGLDTVNSVKQAKEFGLDRRMRIAPLLMFLTDVHALGLDTAQGLVLTESFYWDLNDRTRAFARKIVARTPNNWPNQAHASAYSSVLHYLKTVADMGPEEAKRSGAATVARMKAMPTEDDAFGRGRIREDGRGIFPAYLFQVKTPAESKGEWDLYKLLSTLPAEEAARPLAETGCRMVRS
ncbi:ABC transporter substrate-binding protein [Paracraurococcus lichenis]|uniref:ABC transporter substrate-binding protein n=1 Tax=Paracraurococcus lichenis TaxID=3064888 RepID=A0ABT9E7C2_9PROT|nr:ABC transporter substrate-binding protein [Paracraurococcus sp. LOR1-02]MDO9712084.1 ABC transporter substrate-binding protein [Paracraurococcus sp. LOR1-02]